jgi:hypothetical protein
VIRRVRRFRRLRHQKRVSAVTSAGWPE